MYFPLAFPAIDLGLRHDGREVFDPVRRRWVRCTPEEWVRQHLIRFLADHRGYPLELMAVEKAFPYHGLMRRADLVAYGSGLKPLVIAECKAPAVALDQRTAEQVARYNTTVGATLWLLTNGLRHFVGTASPVRLLADIPPREAAEQGLF
ncbi:MAG: type I restriction enzyme HsdR N-terminal domain-containing protein [Rhodothermales bacterium]|nr:type I restriction enzyme HsdR N-terminal domain-containing protein [Rhodothermales bacterium]